MRASTRGSRSGPRVSAMALSLSLAMAGIAGATLSATALAQAAQAAQQQFTIPAGNLRGALDTLAEQSRITVMYSPDLVAGKSTRGLSGRFAPAEALRRLLQGSGLEAQDAGDSTFTLRRAPARPGTPRTPAHEPRRAPGDDEVVGLPAIMVQGKRTLNMDIARTENDPQPYVVFDRETIRQSSAQNLEGFLRDRLPMNANGLANIQRVTQFGTQSSFNLRGLGAGQTLILIDGRRATPGPAMGSSPQPSDINGIPLSAVERVEVLPATASGIYGGSATGGVINIILRQDYAGAEVKMTYGNSFKSDVASRRIDMSVGFNPGERTNLLLTASWSDQNPLYLRERPELVERYYATVRANAPGLLLPPNNPPLGSTTNIRSADGSNLVLRDGTPLNSPITHIPIGYAGTSTDGGRALIANAGSYNLGLAQGQQHITGAGTQIAQAPTTSALRATLRQEFTPRVSAFLEVGSNRTRTSGPNVSTRGAFLGPYRISASAPNNPFNRDILVTVPDASLTGLLETEATQDRATAGLIIALPAEWKAAADYTWGRTRVRQSGSGGVSRGADTAAVLNGTVDVLRDTNVHPVNLVGLLEVFPLEGSPKVTLNDVSLRFAGPVLNLPAGAVTVSTLFEYRDEAFAESTQSSAGTRLIYPSRSASATSLYLETKIPLFSEKNRRSGLEALDLQFAARVDEYRTRGKTGFVIVGSNNPVVSASNETRSVNPTVAIRYQPMQDLVLRTSYGTGFVPPNVGQLAPSIALSPLTIIDPRRGNTATTIAVGGVLQGGNPNLEPEESKSWSMGAIWTPRFAPGLRLSLDYTRIRKTRNIAAYPTGVQGLINDEALFPERVQRGANLPGDPAGWAGPITLLDVTLFNVASAEMEALDLQLDYAKETSLGTFSVSTVATRQFHLKTTSLAGQPTLENVGVTYSNPQAFVGNAELKWQRNAWTASWLARYYDSYLTANPAIPANASHIALQGNGGRVPSQSYHDVYVGWAADLSARPVPGFLAGAEIQFGIRNVFDKLPPFDANFYNVFRTFHSPLGDPLGTTYQLAITKRF